MNISLPDDMKDFIDRQVAERGFGTSSEFVRDLIRREQDRLHMRNLILEGMASPRVAVADAAYFQKLRDRVADARNAADAKKKIARKRA